ncbi:37S ribosomal protein s9 [Diplocarpon rosae]|nr:37S ribosomal protein s9 [Diplocarpon rosae]
MRVAWLPAGLREGLRYANFSRNVPTNHTIQRIVPKASAKFSTTRIQSSVAAPEIKFDEKDGEGDEEGKTFFARLIPSSPSYFTAQPIFTDDLLILQSLINKYSSLPTLKAGEGPRVAWRSLTEYRNMTGESIKAAKYHKIVEMLQRLNSIHPSLQPRDVKVALKEYKRDINPFQNAKTLPPVDKLGRTLGAGRRKSSTARAWVVEGTGEVLINGKTLAEAFGRIHDRESAIWALKATDRMNKYNVWALVEGGGTTGQAEALTLAVGKALLAQEPALKPALRRAGCMTRDPRRVERKKPGHVKARKMPTWVKR